MATTVRHDPFARGEYRRECAGAGTCAWCGQARKRVYTYTWEEDSSSRRARYTDRRQFCNLECFDSYHG